MGDVEWLTTAAEKVGHLEQLEAEATVEAREQLSADGAPRAASQFSSVLPIGVAQDGRTVLLFLANEPTTEGFRSFLQSHAALLRVAPSWTLRIVFPRPLDHAYDSYLSMIHEELESPLHAATIGELQSYFDLRLQAARGEAMHPLTQGFLRKGHEVFGTPRFTAMLSGWVTKDPDDDKFIDAALSGGAAIIVSGDRHLLALGTVEGIEILTARQFLDRLAAVRPEVPPDPA